MRRAGPAIGVALAALLACSSKAGSTSAQPVPDGGVGLPDAGPPPGGGVGPGWVTVAAEDFEAADLGSPAWQPDPVPDDGPYSDAGAFFQAQGVTPPPAWRIAQPFGAGSWLTAESYTQTQGVPFSDLAAVVADPADPANHVLRIRSPLHTDATVIRPSAPLPVRYRISLRVGWASFGDGTGANGYPASEAGATAGPWSPDVPIAGQNGFYWLTILDAQPRPHNNTWIHHHRKVVIDVDNNQPPWTYVWNGAQFVLSGEHPIDFFAIDGRGTADAHAGKPFIPYAAGAWQPSGTVRAVDAYLPQTWYRVSIERDGTRFTISISGKFRYGGDTTYTATIDAAARCVWHFNRSADEDASACLSDAPLPGLGAGDPQWPAGATWPDWFMFGDPHENFYAGEAYFDDVKLEAWRD